MRKNLSALNRFADDSSKYTDFNTIIESTVLDLDQLELLKRKHNEEGCLECKGGLCFIDFTEGLHKGLKEYKDSDVYPPLPELGVKLRHNPNLIWEGKDLQESKFGEKEIILKLANRLEYKCSSDHFGCLKC